MAIANKIMGLQILPFDPMENSSRRLPTLNGNHIQESRVAMVLGRNKMQKQVSLPSHILLKTFSYKTRLRRYTRRIVASLDHGMQKHSKSNQVSMSRGNPVKYFDFAIIGSGVAGLRYALEVAKHGSVAVITKAEPHESNTNYAQGGVSAVLDPFDSIENHIRDTIVAGAYLCDEETVKVVCTEGPERVRELMAFGASFDQGEDGSLHLAREGGHSHHRIVHAADMTGREIERALLKAVVSNPNITMLEHHFAIDLLTSEDGSNIYCHGVDTLNSETNEVIRFISKVTLLASGGAGHTYPNTTNPCVCEIF